MMFSVATHRRADTVCVAVIGEIDMSTTMLLEQALTDALATDAHAITVDLSATTFCDCTGITTLLAARRSAQAANLRYTVTNPQRFVRQVMDTLGLRDLLTGIRTDNRFDYGAHGAPRPDRWSHAANTGI